MLTSGGEDFLSYMQSCLFSLRRILCLILCGICCNIAIARAQYNISGIVKDTVLRPMEFATAVIWKDSSIISSANTDSLGRFVLKVPVSGSYRLAISHVNANDFYLHLTIVADTVVKVVMTGKYRSLNTVIVRGEQAFTRKADRFVFTPGKELSAHSAGLDIMRHVPMIKYDEANGSFNIIGKASTIVYINNRKTEMPREMVLQLLRAMPADNIKSIELITNPGSEYAAAVTGGIININLRKQLYEGWIGSLSLDNQQGPYNKTIGGGYVGYRKGKIAVQLTPSLSSNYNYMTSESVMTYNNGQENILTSDFYRRYSVIGSGLKLDYDISSRNLLSYEGWFSSVNGKSDATTLAKYKRIGKSTPDSLQHLQTTGKDHYIYNFGNVNYRHLLDAAGNTYWDANIDYNYFFQRQRNDWGIVNADSEGAPGRDGGVYRSNLPQRFLNISGRLELIKPLRNGIQFNAGAQISLTKVDDNLHYFTQHQGQYIVDSVQSVHYNYSEKYYGGFINFSKTYAQKLSVKAGIRVEATSYGTEEKKAQVKSDSNYVNLFPSLAISYTPSQQHQFSISYSRKIIRPNIEILFPGRTYLSQHYYSQPNPFLQPTLAHVAEFSYSLKSKYVMNATYTANNKSFAEFIIPVVSDGVNQLQKTYLNYGQDQSLNLVLNIHESFFNKFWSVYLTPSYLYSHYRGTTAAVPVQLTNNSFNVLFDNYFYLSRKNGWMGFITFNYNGPVKSIDTRRLNGFTTLDLEVKKTYKQLAFYVILSDVYNGGAKRLHELYPNLLLSKNNYNTNLYTRNIVLRIRYSFGNSQMKTNRRRSSANDDMRRRLN